MSAKVHILIPVKMSSYIKHLKLNLYRRNSGMLDLLCLLHGLSAGIIFVERIGKKHCRANDSHLRRKLITIV